MAGDGRTPEAELKRLLDLQAPFRLAEQARSEARAVPEPQPAQEGGVGPLGWGARETAAHRAWRERREQADAAYRTALRVLPETPDALQNRIDEMQKEVDRAQQAATKAAQATPDIRTVNGIPMERGPDGIYRPVRVGTEGGAAPAAAGATGGAASTTAPKGTKRTRTERAPAPDQRMFTITEESDGFGNWSYVSAEPIEGSAPAGAAEERALELQTAQTNLARAQQQTQQAAAQGPVEQARAQVQLEQARVQLEDARRKAAQDILPAVVSAPATQRVIVQRDPTTGELTAIPNPAYQAPPSELIQPGANEVLTFRDPTTGAITTQPNPAYRAPLPKDPYAAYEQEYQRVQTLGEREIARLEDQQRQGRISAPDAQRQFEQWLAQQTEQLTGLEAAAREAERAEQIAFAQAQRAEQQRVEGLERTRQQIGLEAGTLARRDLAAVFPNVRTPQFLQQYGGLVSSMAARAAAPSAAAAARLPAAPGISADTFNPANFRAAMPDLDQYAREATARALAQISPIAAATINRPMPRFPTPVDVPAMLARVPYRGPLQAPPPGVQPLPGQGAIDLGTGQARSLYPGGSWLDWPIGEIG